MDPLKNRFFAYVDRFYSSNAADNQAIGLKRAHTRRVCRNSLMLANKLHLSDSDARLAEIMALFHDVGRFKQFWVYKTFKDADSEDHASLSVSEIKAHSLLSGLAQPDIDLICQVIQLHNTFEPPGNLGARVDFFLRLLRDADKLDIWKVFGDYYEDHAGSESVTLGLPDTAACSRGAIDAVRGGRLVRTSDLKTLNDFKLLQASWIYDLNFAPTLAAMLEKGCLDRLRTFLPKTAEIEEAFEKVAAYAAAAMEAGMEIKAGRKEGG